MNTLVNGHILLTIAQSIFHLFLLPFAKIGKSSCDLLTTFIFNKFVSYDVVIPGETFTLHMPISFDVIYVHYVH